MSVKLGTSLLIQISCNSSLFFLIIKRFINCFTLIEMKLADVKKKDF